MDRVTREARAQRNSHAGAVVWLTGLSGAGKSSLALRAESGLFDKGYAVYMLDGDELRRGVNSDLGYSEQDRHENIRRAGAIAALLADAGMIVLAAFISPYASDRESARKAAGEHFHEVFVCASLAECERRDPRGLYRRARKGEIPDFTGISAPYERPARPDLEIDTEHLSVDAAVDLLIAYIESHVRPA